MATTHKRKYGIDWPADYPDEMIELQIAKKYKEFNGLNPSLDHPATHLLRACRALYAPRELVIHRWTEQMAVDWTTEDFGVIWGAASTGKSNTIGLFALLDFVTDPHHTITFIGSTSLASLKRRSWESVIRYANILMKHPAIDFSIYPKPSGYAILATPGTDSEMHEEKAGIFGVALQDGSRMQGSHLPYVRIIVDELAALEGDGPRQAIEEALANLKAGSKSLRFWGLANPTSHYDLSGVYSEPLDGWSSVNVNHETWRTKFGIVRHLDGLRSPAIVEEDGARKYPFLINQEAVDQVRNTAGEDSLRYNQMVRGWPSNQASVATVLTETDLAAGHATETRFNGTDLGSIGTESSPFFRTIRVAAVDAAFSQGGDDAVVQEVRVVYLSSLPVLYFPEAHKIPILDSSDRPVTYQLVDFLRGWCAERDISMDMLAADDSGTQSLADVLSVEIAPGVMRVNYARSASDKPVNSSSEELAKKKYKDCITEGWTLLAEFIKMGQVRGLSVDCARQLVSRQYVTNKAGVVQEPRRLEPKTMFKARTKLGSPDEADAAAMAALLIRHRLGITPGSGVYPQRLARAPDLKPAISLRSASSFRAGASTGDPFAKMMGRYK